MFSPITPHAIVITYVSLLTSGSIYVNSAINCNLLVLP